MVHLHTAAARTPLSRSPVSERALPIAVMTVSDHHSFFAPRRHCAPHHMACVSSYIKEAVYIQVHNTDRRSPSPPLSTSPLTPIATGARPTMSSSTLSPTAAPFSPLSPKVKPVSSLSPRLAPFSTLSPKATPFVPSWDPRFTPTSEPLSLPPPLDDPIEGGFPDDPEEEEHSDPPNLFERSHSPVSGGSKHNDAGADSRRTCGRRQ